MFIAALFIIARTWKLPKGPLTDELIKKMWYICPQYSLQHHLQLLGHGSNLEVHWQKNAWRSCGHIHGEILHSHKKERIWVSSNVVDEPRTYYIEWSKSEREREISYFNAYIQKLEKWYWRIHLQGSNGETDIENRLMDMGRGEERVRGMERVTWKLTLPSVK